MYKNLYVIETAIQIQSKLLRYHSDLFLTMYEEAKNYKHEKLINAHNDFMKKLWIINSKINNEFLLNYYDLLRHILILFG